MVTRDELRAHLRSVGISYTQFVERVAELQGATKHAERKNAIRNAKRWVSPQDGGEELRLQTATRLIAAKAAELDPAALLPHQPRSTKDRLEAVEADLLWATETIERILAALRRAGIAFPDQAA